MNKNIKIISIFSGIGLFVTLAMKFNNFYDTFISTHFEVLEKSEFFLAILMACTTIYLFLWTLSNFVTKNEFKKKCSDLNRELNSNYITKDTLSIALEKLHQDIKDEITNFKSTIKEQHDDTLRILTIIANQRGAGIEK